MKAAIIVFGIFFAAIAASKSKYEFENSLFITVKLMVSCPMMLIVTIEFMNSAVISKLKVIGVIHLKTGLLQLFIPRVIKQPVKK